MCIWYKFILTELTVEDLVEEAQRGEYPGAGVRRPGEGNYDGHGNGDGAVWLPAGVQQVEVTPVHHHLLAGC